MSDNTKKPIKGGEFIIRDTAPSEIFIPENWTEEQRMIADMCDDFIATEVVPNVERIDSMEEGLMPSIMEKAGELASDECKPISDVRASAEYRKEMVKVLVNRELKSLFENR